MTQQHPLIRLVNSTSLVSQILVGLVLGILLAMFMPEWAKAAGLLGSLFVGVIVLGLKGLQIEQHAQEVMAYCAQLQSDFGKFKDDFELVGTHVGRAQNKFVDAQKRLGRFESKLEQAGDAPVELAAEVHELPGIDAA